MSDGWKSKRCESCRGTGVRDGYDRGPLDCEHCNGGTVWISPKGFHAAYPGGPFLGGNESGDDR